LAEWLYEDGIGEERAILIDQGRIVAAFIERKDGVKLGLIAKAQLTKQLVAGKRGIAKLDSGAEVLVTPLPKDLTEGGSLLVEITREAIREDSRFKLPLARACPDKEPKSAPSLLDRIAGDGLAVKHCRSHEPDHFETAGWSELIEEARTGRVAFATGTLLIAVTPAMTLIDVDGDAPPLALALDAAVAAGQAIRRLGIQGSIGIDFPNLEAKADRIKVAEALDDAMTSPCERTAVNGFGFLQIVTRRQRPSLLELVQGNRTGAHMYALLRRAERDRGTGPMTLVAHPAITTRLSARAIWLQQLAERSGRAVALRADPALDMGGGYVE
jgi:Ribonuclease E/G family